MKKKLTGSAQETQDQATSDRSARVRPDARGSARAK